MMWYQGQLWILYDGLDNTLWKAFHSQTPAYSNTDGQGEFKRFVLNMQQFQV